MYSEVATPAAPKRGPGPSTTACPAPAAHPARPHGSTALPSTIETWGRRSAMGATLTGFALGLKEALDPTRDEPAIVAQVSGDPVGAQPIEAALDDLRPRQSIVTIRPWLLADRPAE